MNRDTILLDIVAERLRQDRLCREGKFPHTTATQPDPRANLVILAEEFGEISRPVADLCAGHALDTENLREELIQLAACCVGWVEQLDEVPQYAPPYQSLPAPPQVPQVPRYSETPSYAPPVGATERSHPAWLDLLPDYGGAL